RQIGVRHETQMLGAIGNCGQICCCRRFMRKFVPVTIKMAKEQNLFLNPTKISGICGRLLCCLSFEQKGYEEFHRMCPRVGKKYTTSLGNVKVLRSNFFKKSLSLLTESYEEKEVSIDEWNEIVNKPPSEEAIAEAEAKAQSVRGRRGGRRPSRPDSGKNTARQGESSEGRDAEKDRKQDRPARRGRDDRRERGERKESGERNGRSRQPNGPDRQSKPASDPAEASGDDKSKRSRRPRRRRRRPPKK
ncbi:regulatory iron-sulfur-containing complex subunit RicT, partial [Pseudodesulfovibrio sp.]|nr:regulatory iron-sulfur-containing complex subunit RicT [Pseudodesulfovibrio sp.]